MDVNSNTTSSYGRYGSSDYASKYGTGGYRRHSASDYNRYDSSGSTARDNKFAGGTATSEYRRYSSTADYSKRYSTGTTLDHKYGSYGSSECRNKTGTLSTDSRRNSTSGNDKSVDEIQEPGRRRNSTRHTDGGDTLESIRVGRRYARADEDINDSKRTNSLETDDSGESSTVFRRKYSVDNRRTHLGLDYNKVIEEDDGKC